MPRSVAGRAVAVLLLAGALAILHTYPIAFRLDRVGRLETGDGHWSIWVVSWVAHALATDPLGLYDANIFHPHRHTLAYSENNVVAGLLGLPAHLLTGNPYATHNTAMLLAFVLAFVCAYALVRHLTRHTGLAIAAALAFTYCPFMFARTAHIQLMMIFGLPLAMLALHRLVERPTAGRGVLLGAVLAVQALACGYYGIFAGMMVGLGVLLYAVTRGLWRLPRYWAIVTLAALISIAIVLPFFLPYVRVQSELGFARTMQEARPYSADWPAWLASNAWAHRWMQPLLGRWQEVLFPGVLTTLAGIGGAVLALRRPASSGITPGAQPAAPPAVPRDTVVLYLLFALLAFWISFGPDAGLYAVLYEVVPVFSLLRAPGRIGIVVVLALAVLMAVGLAPRLLARTWRTRALTGVLIVGLGVELASMPLAVRQAEPPNAAYRLLRVLPRGPLVELPFFWERMDFPRHAWYMSGSTWHWQPLINGYSDHIPRDFRHIARAMSTFPARHPFRLLKERNARYVAFHLRWYDARSRERLFERLEAYKAYLRPLSRADDVWLYEIVGWPE